MTSWVMKIDNAKCSCVVYRHMYATIPKRIFTEREAFPPTTSKDSFRDCGMNCSSIFFPSKCWEKKMQLSTFYMQFFIFPLCNGSVNITAQLKTFSTSSLQVCHTKRHTHVSNSFSVSRRLNVPAFWEHMLFQSGKFYTIWKLYNTKGDD